MQDPDQERRYLQVIEYSEAALKCPAWCLLSHLTYQSTYDSLDQHIRDTPIDDTQVVVIVGNFICRHHPYDAVDQGHAGPLVLLEPLL